MKILSFLTLALLSATSLRAMNAPFNPPDDISENKTPKSLEFVGEIFEILKKELGPSGTLPREEKNSIVETFSSFKKKFFTGPISPEFLSCFLNGLTDFLTLNPFPDWLAKSFEFIWNIKLFPTANEEIRTGLALACRQLGGIFYKIDQKGREEEENLKKELEPQMEQFNSVLKKDGIKGYLGGFGPRDTTYVNLYQRSIELGDWEAVADLARCLHGGLRDHPESSDQENLKIIRTCLENNFKNESSSSKAKYPYLLSLMGKYYFDAKNYNFSCFLYEKSHSLRGSIDPQELKKFFTQEILIHDSINYAFALIRDTLTCVDDFLRLEKGLNLDKKINLEEKIKTINVYFEEARKAGYVKTDSKNFTQWLEFKIHFESLLFKGARSLVDILYEDYLKPDCTPEERITAEEYLNKISYYLSQAKSLDFPQKEMIKDLETEYEGVLKTLKQETSNDPQKSPSKKKKKKTDNQKFQERLIAILEKNGDWKSFLDQKWGKFSKKENSGKILLEAWNLHQREGLLEYVIPAFKQHKKFEDIVNLLSSQETLTPDLWIDLYEAQKALEKPLAYFLTPSFQGAVEKMPLIPQRLFGLWVFCFEEELTLKVLKDFAEKYRAELTSVGVVSNPSQSLQIHLGNFNLQGFFSNILDRAKVKNYNEVALFCCEQLGLFLEGDLFKLKLKKEIKKITFDEYLKYLAKSKELNAQDNQAYLFGQFNVNIRHQDHKNATLFGQEFIKKGGQNFWITMFLNNLKLNETLNNKEKENAELKKTLKEINAQNKDLQTQLEKIRAEPKADSAEVKTLMQTIQERNQKIANLNKAKEDLAKELIREKDEVSKRESEIAQLKTELEKADKEKEKIDGLNKEVSQIKADLGKAQQDSLNYQNASNEKDRTIGSLKKEIKNLNQELDTLGKQNKTAEDSYNERSDLWMDNLKEGERKIALLKQEIEKLKKQQNENIAIKALNNKIEEQGKWIGELLKIEQGLKKNIIDTNRKHEKDYQEVLMRWTKREEEYKKVIEDLKAQLYSLSDKE